MKISKATISELRSLFGDERIQLDKNISPYLTLRTKVIAEVFIEVRSREEWVTLATFLEKTKIPYFIFGGGSNVAVVTPTLEGIVVRNMYQKKEIVAETDSTVDLLVSSGYAVARLAKETAEAGYEGFEYHMGLPGTLGGGIVMNSKWTRPDSYLGDSLLYAAIIGADGKERRVKADYFEFSYGYSKLQMTKELFIEGVFRLKKNDPVELMRRARESAAYRSETQPKGQFTSGCFFKNISTEEQEKIGVPTKSAGYLIDHAGLKGTAVGGYYISDKHANFIMNSGEGKPEDLRDLANLVKAKVKEKYGIELREEVIVL